MRPDEPRAAIQILNVNDDAAARYALGRALTYAGFAVEDAETGVEALEKIAARPPQLVLLDIKLPDIDGFEVCRRIKAHPSTSTLPVLQISARLVRSADRVHGLEGGADGYLVQPVEPEELVATVRALLRMRAAEESATRRAEALAEADRKKDEFLAMLAHELRNPLAAMAAALQSLGRRPPPDDHEQRLRAILGRQTAQLTRLVDDLLEVSRFTRGQVELRRVRIDLRDAITEAVADCQASIDARGHHLTVTLPPEPVVVDADPARLEQVVTNLLDNACKYTPPGGRIDLRLTREPQQATLRIRDDGVGIPAEAQARIFELFAQVDPTLDRAKGGLGIGLTLVRALVVAQGGSVAVHSAGAGTGSEFVVVLPILPAGTLAAPPRRPERPAISVRRIVLVEDNDDAREALKDLIESWGVEVITAVDGRQGVRAILEVKPQLALVDLGLPGLDGYGVARAVRGDPAGRDIPLVALTGYGDLGARQQTEQAGFDRHVTKPVDPDALEALLAGPPAR